MSVGVLIKDKNQLKRIKWMEGKHILITGVSDGIGKELCKQ